MKVIIAGGRDIHDRTHVEAAIRKSGFEIDEVVEGGADGVDELGHVWAVENEIPCTHFHPDWDKHGRAAGPIRNAQMADYADALILVWDGESRGSASMKREAEKRGLKIYEHIVRAVPEYLDTWGAAAPPKEE